MARRGFGCRKDGLLHPCHAAFGHMKTGKEFPTLRVRSTHTSIRSFQNILGGIQGYKSAIFVVSRRSICNSLSVPCCWSSPRTNDR